MKRILIIDDDEEMCAELGDILRREGFDIDVCLDGVSGRQKIESGKYDLAILDLKLPGLNGYAVLKTVKESRLPIKIFVISGRPLAGELVDSTGDYYKEEGDDILKLADTVMNKPFAVDVFLNRVRALIAS